MYLYETGVDANGYVLQIVFELVYAYGHVECAHFLWSDGFLECELALRLARFDLCKNIYAIFFEDDIDLAEACVHVSVDKCVAFLDEVGNGNGFAVCAQFFAGQCVKHIKTPFWGWVGLDLSPIVVYLRKIKP
jgi:hypothetical protein